MTGDAELELDELGNLVPHDDELGNVTATPDDAAYESGYHDGIDYGYRHARALLATCPVCGADLTEIELDE